MDGVTYVIPTVWDGKFLELEEATKRALDEGVYESFYGREDAEEFDKEMVTSSMRQDWNSYSVPVSTLDNYVLSNNIKKIDLIKIDVESHEPYVIRGAIKTISQFKPIIYLEIGGKKSFLDQIAAEMPECYELINPETMARLNKNDNLPWDVVFAPKEV